MPPQERAFLTEQFSKLEGPVKLDYFHQTDSTVAVPGRPPCPTCGPTKEVLEELAELSDQITLTTYEFSDNLELAERRKVERAPGIVARGEINRPVRIIGMPGGVLLPLLVQSLLSVSGKPPDPGSEVKSTLKKLRNAVHLRVVGAMMDPATGDAAIAAILLALLSPRIEVSIYNLDEYPDLAAQTGMSRIPGTLINERQGFSGATTAPELARYLYDLEAHPDRAKIKPPTVASGSAHPWQPPPPPHSGPGGPGRGPRPPGPPGGAPPGMRRTESGLIVPNG